MLFPIATDKSDGEVSDIRVEVMVFPYGSDWIKNTLY